MSTEAPPEVEEVPVETPEEIPAADPVETPEEIPAADPIETPEEIPAADPVETPADDAPAEEPEATDETAAEDSPDDDADATEETPPVEEPATPAFTAPAPGVRVQATGKRKSAIARVIVEAGDGTIVFHDGRTLEEYFGRQTLVAEIRRPLEIVGADANYRITARIIGGGLGGQAGALRHAISRALIKLDENLRPALKREGFLTRDARVKERKKAGLKGARKRPQFSKR